ncbi:MAG: hypothetical protein L3J41_13470 [Melioribacteraceae bacterium]|nr:hypothetical protein [Melioribacteraceae bacterium]
MGTKQLLLIVLGIIVIGVAVTVSLEVFDTQFSGQIRDMAIQQMNDIGTNAKTYRTKPKDIGGGGGSYKGFKIPESLKEDALSWKFDLKATDDRLNFYMISKQFVYNQKPYFLLGVNEKGELTSIKLFDPEKNDWKTIFEN